MVNVLFALRILGGMGDTVECVITGGQFDKSADRQAIEFAWKSFYRLYF